MAARNKGFCCSTCGRRNTCTCKHVCVWSSEEILELMMTSKPVQGCSGGGGSEYREPSYPHGPNQQNGKRRRGEREGQLVFRAYSEDPPTNGGAK